jgi:arylsulfatase A-like enzyme
MALYNYYTFIDAQIGELLKRTDRKTFVFVITDHGEFAVGRKGTHKNNGFIISAGPGVRRINYRHASVLDIAPTVLYLLDLPVGRDMDGRVLTEGFDRRLLLEKPIAYIDSYDRLLRGQSQTVVVDQKLEEQDTEELKALGYIN